MGVAGSGKSTIGKQLAARTDWPFHDGDDFHSKENVEKMRQGIPLDDRDRAPWLLAIRAKIETYLESDQNAVFACSALKQSYREVLQREDKRVRFVYLKGKPEDIAPRMAKRKNHFMPAGLLQSQFDALEEPAEAVSTCSRL
ncbi:MAG: gluconokinase [Bacteroidetes bacterium]|nr:MAG: gluconokinase [Bacteroidota bacterium]